MLHFIYNPRADACKKDFLKKLEKKLKNAGAEYDMIDPEAHGGLEAYVKKVTSEEENPTLIAVGGDGTMNVLLSAIPDPSRVTLGLIPAGTGNDFAKAARIPRGCKALRLILGCEAKPTDYLEEESGRRSMNIAGLGIDVDILERYERARRAGKHGAGLYYKCLLASLRKFEPVPMRVVADGTECKYNALIAAECNGQYFGGGIHICPAAKLDDGLMDLVVIDFPKRSKIVFYLMKLKMGKVLKLKIAHHVRCKRAEIYPEGTDRVQLDGELVTLPALKLRVVAGGIKFYRG